MSVVGSVSPSKLSALVNASRLVNDVRFGGLALMIVDYMHTLPAEVRLIWPTRLSTSKVIFMAGRYGNFVLTITECLYTLGYMFSSAECQSLLTAVTVLEVILSLLNEGIMYIRVLAFSGRNQRVLYLLVLAYVTTCALAFTLLGKWIQSSVVSAGAIPGLGCSLLADSHIYVTVMHVVLLSSITLLVVMLLVIGFHRYRMAGVSIWEQGGSLLHQFYRAGLWYFLVLLALNVANIIVNLVGYRYMLLRLQIHLHGMLVTRIVLQLRRYAEDNQTVVLGATDILAEDEAAMAGFAMPNCRGLTLEPIHFTTPPPGESVELSLAIRSHVPGSTSPQLTSLAPDCSPDLAHRVSARNTELEIREEAR